MRPAIVAGLLVALTGCLKSGADPAATEVRVPVSIGPVLQDTITNEVRLVGRLAPVPGGAAQLTSPADAVVKQVLVQVGDRVRAGTLLVQLDAPELETRAEELGVAAVVAREDAQRQADLYAQGITSRKQYDERQASALAAESAARAARELLQRASVRSPITGGVQRVEVQAGERVVSGGTLVEVVDGSRLDLVAQVPAGPLSLLRVGQPARILSEAASGTVDGRVVAIAPAVDTLTNAASVIVRVPNSNLALRAGTGAVATVDAGIRPDALIVPDSAIVLVGDVTSVFVMDADSVVHVRPVRVGLRQRDRVQVTGELKGGDLIVTGNAFGLSDGMRVTVPAKSPE